MIDKKSHTKEWITGLRGRLGKRIDPKLIEKVIYALTFLEQLRLNGLEFVFKGGTALLLTTDFPSRFSIDVDIITQEPESKIRDILDKISRLDMFTRWVDDNDRKHSPGAPVGHFKMFYKSVVDGHEEPVLVDLLYAPNQGYPVIDMHHVHLLTVVYLLGLSLLYYQTRLQFVYLHSKNNNE